MIKLEQGKKLIKLAREAIFSYFLKKDVEVDEDVKREFSDIVGVFVTLNKEGMLRGCIGFPEGVYPLYEAIIKAARSSAFSDPRFMPLGKGELDKVSIEISILTKPEKIVVSDADEYIKKIKVGSDGLIVRSDFGSGLLLPQVATEYNWDTKRFLEQTCVKAGLEPDSWMNIDFVEVYKFQSQVFSEIRANGEVKQLM